MRLQAPGPGPPPPSVDDVGLDGLGQRRVEDHGDPLRPDPVATVQSSCVGCGLCGEVAHAAVLCPSFYRTDVIQNPNWRDKVLVKIRAWWIKSASRGLERRAARFEAA